MKKTFVDIASFSQLDLDEYCELLGYKEGPLWATPDAPSMPLSEEAPDRSRYHCCEGNLKARLIFVGEASSTEPQGGRPFVGPSGELLDKMIAAMGLRREDLYLVQLQRAPDGSLADSEREAYFVPLKKLIQDMRPPVVVSLGAFASQILLSSDWEISRMRGSSWSFALGDGTESVVIPTFHPAYLLRNADRKKDVWEDLQKALAILSRPL